MRDVLTIQGHTVKFPFKALGNWAFFQFCPYFYACLSLKSGKSTSMKVIFSKLTRTDLLLHNVKNFEVENCGLRKHLKLGEFLTIFLLEIENKHLVVEWFSWLACKCDFVNYTIFET